MGHPHLQRLKTKLTESNERLEESNRCIAALRAQYASLEAESTGSIASLRAQYASLEGESTENIASLRAQCAHDNVDRDREAVCHQNATEEAHNALVENMMLVETARQREREEQYNVGTQNIQRVAREECDEEISLLRRGNAELEEEIRWLRGVDNENKEEIRLLRGRVEEVMGNVTTLKRDNARRTRVEYNTKRSVLRSFKWNISRVDPDLFRVATAFWGATQDNSETLGRTTKEMRKKTLKALIKQCFDGELYVEIEKEIMKKVRFKVFKLARLSDLESKFNADAVGSIAHAQEGLKKHMRGLLPSDTTVRNCLTKINRGAMAKGLSSMIDTKTWCWGDAHGNKLREGAHRYIKAVYVDKWDTRVTANKPYIVALTGDLARVSLNNKAVTLCGVKECDPRLVSQKRTQVNNLNDPSRAKTIGNQSRNLYIPAMGGYTDESTLMPLFEELVEIFVEVEKQKYCVVDGKQYEVHIDVKIVADMMFLHKFTERGGCCASTTFFCMFCSCMSKFRHEGQPGGCDACKLEGTVYDDKGIFACIHHDMMTPERTKAFQDRLAFLQTKLQGKVPKRKKPVWGDLAGLRQACLERCVPGVTNKDGHDAYNVRDKTKLKTMNTTACEAWLNQRTEGT